VCHSTLVVPLVVMMREIRAKRHRRMFGISSVRAYILAFGKSYVIASPSLLWALWTPGRLTSGTKECGDGAHFYCH
jgi:hypothetical protein